MAGQQGASYEQELASYLQERIRPGLNRGAIPLLARSIAKELASREHNGTSQDAEDGDEQIAEADDEVTAEGEDTAEAEAGDEDGPEAEAEAGDEDGAEAEADDEADDQGSAEAGEDQSADGDEWTVFEDDMHELQAEFGEDWIVRFSVQGDDVWLTAEKDDGSQHVEAQTADALAEVVGLLNENGGG
jgi:hypothetical protein